MALVRFLPTETRLRFMTLRKVSFPLSAALSMLTFVLFVTMGLNFGIDFRGGTLMEARSTSGPADVATLRSTLGDLGLDGVQIQEFGEPEDVLIRFGSDEEAEGELQAQVSSVRNALGADYEIRRVETVGPSVSSELIRNSAVAVLLSMFSILIYLWFRFEWQFALGAVITTLHDVFMMVGIYLVMQIDFDLTSIAALLTVMGYSINDTVVIYDRIREMLRKYKKMPIKELLDIAVNSMLSRTIVTSLTTLLAVLALHIFGGEAIHGFTTAMLVGVVVGTYSSIFIAAPILI